MPEIVVDNLSHTFGKDTDRPLTVLQDIDLTFATSSFNTIVGTSGCGKSTLLKMMAGLIEPSDGRTTLDGEVIRGTDRRRGMVFQQDAGDLKRRRLYLGNGPKLRAIAKVEKRFEQWGFEVDRYWAFGGQFPPSLSGYDAIFLSGSPHGAYENLPFIIREHELIQDARDEGIPMLGICFGSQILGSALCGRDQVFRRKECEIGYAELSINETAMTDPLLGDIDKSMIMFVWHNDEVRDGHRDMRILASTDACPNHIWRYRKDPIWGIQGHPELLVEDSRRWFEENRQRMESDGADVDELVATARETPLANRLLNSFAQLVINGHRE